MPRYVGHAQSVALFQESTFAPESPRLWAIAEARGLQNPDGPGEVSARPGRPGSCRGGRICGEQVLSLQQHRHFTVEAGSTLRIILQQRFRPCEIPGHRSAERCGGSATRCPLAQSEESPPCCGANVEGQASTDLKREQRRVIREVLCDGRCQKTRVAEGVRSGRQRCRRHCCEAPGKNRHAPENTQESPVRWSVVTPTSLKYAMTGMRVESPAALLGRFRGKA